MSAWDYGPGNADDTADWSLSGFLSGASSAISQIVKAGNDINASLQSSTITTNSRTDSAVKNKGVPIWVWIVGAAIVYKVTR